MYPLQESPFQEGTLCQLPNLTPSCGHIGPISCLGGHPDQLTQEQHLPICAIYHNAQADADDSPLPTPPHPSPPEDDAVYAEGVLNDACGGHSDAEDVLLGGHIVLRTNAVQTIQVTAAMEYIATSHTSISKSNRYEKRDQPSPDTG